MNDMPKEINKILSIKFKPKQCTRPNLKKNSNYKI